jgi:hypothetical protein
MKKTQKDRKKNAMQEKKLHKNLRTALSLTNKKQNKMQMRKRKKIYIDRFKNSLRVRYAND